MSQSIATNSIVKSLSDLSAAADKIIEVKPSEFVPSRISDWTAIVKNTADSIVEKNENEENDLEEMPTLMSVLTGKNKRSRARASVILTEMQRMHLHTRKSENLKVQKTSLGSLRTPLLRKYSAKNSLRGGTPKVTPIVIKRVGSKIVASSSGKKAKTQSKENTPLNEEGTTNTMETQPHNSSKRKSIEIMPKSVKNAKIDANQPPQGDKERKKLMQNPKEGEKLVKAKDPSPLQNYSTIKSANIPSGVSLNKESRTLRSKMEAKQDIAAENRKNLVALQQQKFDQNKKIREEKNEEKERERVMQQQQKLKKQKLGKEPTPKTINKTVSKNGTPREASNSVLKLQYKEKKTPQKKLLDEAKKTKTGTHISVSKNKGINNQKLETKQMLNSTYIANEEEPSTSSKGKIVKVNTNAEAMKDISNEKMKDKNATKTVKPPKKETSESYAITPARSSFVSYDISEIRSDSDDEETDTGSKPIPSWATGVRLRKALLQQHHHPIDSDLLFGNIFPAPNLVSIFGVNKKQYHKRTSSAVWSSFS